MKAAGAEVAAIAAVAPHFYVRELVAASPLPVVTIFEPHREELAARAARRVAIFGTGLVMESSLFGQVEEVEIIKARPEEEDYIHKPYGELAGTGKGSEEQHRQLSGLAHTLVRRDGSIRLSWREPTWRCSSMPRTLIFPTWIARRSIARRF
jgi:aspartate/glutamate racemase